MRSVVIYKLELLSVKYVPMRIASMDFISNILAYFDIYLDITLFIGGSSILTTIPMYISSCVYKFCIYHKMAIHYIVVNKIVAFVDNYFIIPVDDFNLLLLNLIIGGIFVSCAIYCHQKVWREKEMNKLTKVIRDLLASEVDDMDAGNSNVDEESAIAIMKAVQNATDTTKRISKYRFCQLAGISRATFDNYVRAGKIPRGEHAIGFKELSWSMKDLDEFKEKYWK